MGRKPGGFVLMDTPTYRVYILCNPDGRLYIGLSDDADRRLAQRNSGVANGPAIAVRGNLHGKARCCPCLMPANSRIDSNDRKAEKVCKH